MQAALVYSAVSAHAAVAETGVAIFWLMFPCLLGWGCALQSAGRGATDSNARGRRVETRVRVLPRDCNSILPRDCNWVLPVVLAAAHMDIVLRSSILVLRDRLLRCAAGDAMTSTLARRSLSINLLIRSSHYCSTSWRLLHPIHLSTTHRRARTSPFPPASSPNLDDDDAAEKHPAGTVERPRRPDLHGPHRRGGDGVHRRREGLRVLRGGGGGLDTHISGQQPTPPPPPVAWLAASIGRVGRRASIWKTDIPTTGAICRERSTTVEYLIMHNVRAHDFLCIMRSYARVYRAYALVRRFRSRNPLCTMRSYA